MMYSQVADRNRRGPYGMTFLAHDLRYVESSELHSSLETRDMLIERRAFRAGVLPSVSCTCTTILVTFAGRTPVRWKRDGTVQRTVSVQPGIAGILPLGFEETETEIVSPVECLQMFLAPSVTGRSALIDYDADPAKTEIVRCAGVSDPLLKEIAVSLLGVISRAPERSDRLFVEGASAMLAAHLVSKYSNISQRRASPSPSLSYDKLNRVLDLVEDRLADEIGLDELAAEARLSPFHFSRLFQKATGLSPHRYVTECRVREAKAKLAEGRLSLVEIALASGFGSQGNFNRNFRKYTGLTPGQYRIEQRS
jgi:AraC family transcriptional regulator